MKTDSSLADAILQKATARIKSRDKSSRCKATHSSI